LPFGAEVVDGSGRHVGVVAQDSRIFARGLEDSGTLVVTLGDEQGEICRIRYALPAKGREASAYVSLEEHCIGASSAMARD